MKKMLLSVVAALTMTASAFAATVGDTYQRVESTADLTIGAEYILCSNTIAMGEYNGSKYYKPVNNAITLSSDSKTATIATAGSAALSFNLVEGSSANTYAIKFVDAATTYYLTCTSVSNGNLNRSTSLVETANLNITIQADFTAKIIPVKNSNTNKNVIQYNKTSGQERFTNYKTGGQQLVTLYKKVTGPVDETKAVTPTFTPASGSAVVAGSTVTIACEEGANVYYTTDETNPTEASTPYTEPIVVNEAMTIKAIAYMEGKTPSSVATATYTIMPSVANIAEFIELIKNNKDGLYSIQTSVTAVYQNGSNLYITDGKDWMLVYGNVEKEYKNGDVIAKGIVGKPLNYSNGLYELSNPDASTFATGVAGSPVEPIIVTEISPEDVNKYVKVQNVNITGQGAYAQDANGNLFTIYNKFKIGLTNATGVNLIGFVGVSNGALQIYPTEITEGEEVFVAAPTFNPAAGEVEAGTKVTISCATEGAEIEYVLNGGSDYIKYTEPIEITEATTIEAYATKDGLEMSDIVTAVYTIKKPVVATPMFDPESGEVEKGTPVTITCATEGATFLYQINEGEPQVGVSGMTITINEATTIEVVASKDGYEDSHASATYTIKGEAPVNPTAMFDFTQPSNLQPALVPPTTTSPSDEQRVQLDKFVFYNNYALIKFNSPDGAKGTNWSQLWNGSDGPQVRAYDGSTITITVAESLTIEKIEFVGAVSSANLKNISYTGSLGSYSYSGTTGTWTRGGVNALAETIGERESVSFNVNGGIRLNQISVTTNGKPTGVEDVTVDENAPVEYYNLQGVRVDNPENGIYIRRQGSKVSKVLVR